MTFCLNNNFLLVKKKTTKSLNFHHSIKPPPIYKTAYKIVYEIVYEIAYENITANWVSKK